MPTITTTYAVFEKDEEGDVYFMGSYKDYEEAVEEIQIYIEEEKGEKYEDYIHNQEEKSWVGVKESLYIIEGKTQSLF